MRVQVGMAELQVEVEEERQARVRVVQHQQDVTQVACRRFWLQLRQELRVKHHNRREWHRRAQEALREDWLPDELQRRRQQPRRRPRQMAEDQEEVQSYLPAVSVEVDPRSRVSQDLPGKDLVRWVALAAVALQWVLLEEVCRNVDREWG